MMILGIDVSTYLEQQRISHPVYKKDGKEVDVFALFKHQGVTYLRTRVWNNPYSEDGKPYLAGTCDLDNFINLCKRVEKYGFKHLLDFHYSDFWTDPSKQYLPKAWTSYSYEQIKDALYQFTQKSLTKVKENGIDLAMIQVGNEITNGFLFPFGKLLEGEEREASFERFTELLSTAIKACHEVYPKAEIVIHLERSFDQDAYREIISHLQKYKVDFDVIGMSYYPFWHHGFDEFFANVDMIQREFHVRVMNAELGYPFTVEDYLPDENGKKKQLVINADNIEEYLKLMPFCPDKQGQAQFVRTFIELAKKHNLEGVFYWEPTWIPGEGICWASKEAQNYQNDNSKETRNEWANQCLFDYEGNALPALEEFKL